MGYLLMYRIYFCGCDNETDIFLLNFHAPEGQYEAGTMIQGSVALRSREKAQG